MKINGPDGTTPAAPSSAKRPSAGGFSLPGAAEAREAVQTNAATGVSASTLDALIAMQAVPDPLERRRRAVSRAGRMLDMLDDVKLALLEGASSAHALERLTQAVREQREGTDDPRLESVLDEIETRAAVELAKQELRRS